MCECGQERETVEHVLLLRPDKAAGPSAALSSWGALCQTQMGGPCPRSLPSPYPFRIPNGLPFKVGFGTYRHNDDKCTHTDYSVRFLWERLGTAFPYLFWPWERRSHT